MVEHTLDKAFRVSKLGRVPEDWTDTSFNTLFEEVVELTNETDKFPLYSLTIENGLIPKTARYDRSFLITKEEDSYKIVSKNEFAYNPMNVRFGALARLRHDLKVSVSGYYNIFRNKSIYNPVFLEYFLKSERMLYLYNSYATGSLVEKQRVHFSQFIKFKLPLPPVEEANKIANILLTWDKAIELKENLIEEIKAQKKGVMKKLMTGKIRIPGFQDKWKTITIEKQCDLSIGKTPSRDENLYWGKGNKWIAISDMKEKYISKTKEEITDKAVDETGIKIIPKGTIIMSFKLTLGKVAITAEDMYSNEAIVSFKIKNENILNKEYLYYYLSSIDIRRYGSRAAKGITLNKESLKQILIKYPSKEEQIRIANFLCTFDKEIDLQVQELDAIKQQKKALLQLLLTGKLRVKV